MTALGGIRESGARWVVAEQRGDVDALDAMTTGDFMPVGPPGLVSNKRQDAQRCRSGGLITETMDRQDIRGARRWPCPPSADRGGRQ
ncbi:hypothetical protein ABIA39_007123 [Nocardia sp. GAS34]